MTEATGPAPDPAEADGSAAPDAAAPAPAADGVTAVLLPVLVVLACVLAGVVAALLLTGGDDDVAAPSPPTVPPVVAALPAEVADCAAIAFGAAPPSSVDVASDPVVTLCAKTALVTALQRDADLPDAAAACTADAVVDGLGLPRVLDLLAGAAVDPAVTEQVQAAVAGCVAG